MYGITAIRNDGPDSISYQHQHWASNVNSEHENILKTRWNIIMYEFEYL